MSYAISKDFHFSASHVLIHLPPGHQCGRMHGHNYLIRLKLAGPDLLPVGFLFDYGDMKPFGAWVDEFLDHRHLNDVMLDNPTAENLAEHLGSVASKLLDLPVSVVVSVGVSETPKSWAWWTP